MPIMEVSAAIKADAESLVFQFLENYNKRLAQEFEKLTKAKPRAKNLPTLTDLVREFKKQKPQQKAAASDSDDSSEEDEAPKKVPITNGKAPAQAKPKAQAVKKAAESSSDSDSDDNATTQPKKQPVKPQINNGVKAPASSSSDDSSDDDAPPKKKPAPAKPAAKQTPAKKKESSSDDSDSEDEKPQQQVKTPVKTPVSKVPNIMYGKTFLHFKDGRLGKRLQCWQHGMQA